MYEMGDEEIEAVTRLLKSGKLFRNQGKDILSECARFEQEFSSYMGAHRSLLVTSGTNALLNALKTAGIGEGDEVLVPCFTFVATPAAVLQSGARPVLVNIDESLSMSAADLEKKVTAKTKAILPVHMDGLPCDMDGIMGIAKKNNLLVIEDVAQAAGGSYRGKKLGTFGFAGCFSFNVDKIISCGEGGAVTFSEEESFKKGLLFQDPGVSFGATFRDYLKDHSPVPGISMRVSEISGTVMRAQLKKLDGILNNLRERKKIFVTALEKGGVDFVRSHDAEGDCGTSLHIRVRDPFELETLPKDLRAEKIYAYPTTARPAHAWWQWIDLLSLPEKSRKELQIDLAPSKIQLTTTLKIHIQHNWDLEETHQKALKLAEKFK